MEINTKNFKRFSKIIDIFNKKGSRIDESIYLDFENSKAYFGNSSYDSDNEGIIGQLDFNFILTNTDIDDYSNVFVNTRLFLTLCNQYETLSMSTDYEFSNGEEFFKIPYFTEEFDYPILNKDDFEVFNITSAITSNLKTSQIYMGVADFNENFGGIQLLNNSIVSSDGACVFEAKVKDITFPEIQLSKTVLHVILTGVDDNTCRMYYDTQTKDLYFTFGDNEELHVASTQIDNLNVPPIEDPDYIAKYNHKTSFCVEKRQFLSLLQFLEVFVTDVKNEQLKLTIESDNTISIKALDEVQASRKMPTSFTSPELEGKSFWFARKYVYDAVSSILDDFIRIQLDVDEVAFNVTGQTETNRAIAITRLLGDEE